MKTEVDPKLVHWQGKEYCYLTTKGRISGKPHRIEIWFGVSGGSLYLLSGGSYRSDWVRNLIAEPAVSVRLGKQTISGMARVVKSKKEGALARRLLAAKYHRWHEGKPLNQWARESLPIALDLTDLVDGKPS